MSVPANNEISSTSAAAASSASNPSMYKVGRYSIAYVVNSIEQCEVALERLLTSMGDAPVLGLDVEYLPPNIAEMRDMGGDSGNTDQAEDLRRKNIRKGRDPLLQLGTPTMAVLIRLCYLPYMPVCLKQLLERRDIVFVGVEITEDILRLRAHWQLRVKYCCDLRHLSIMSTSAYHSCVQICNACERFSAEYSMAKFNLKSIGAFLGQDIDDSVRHNRYIACSNWAAPTLSHRQITYAAKDAMAAAGSYIKMVTEYSDLRADAQSSIFIKAFATYRPYFNRPYAQPGMSRNKMRKKLRSMETGKTACDMSTKAFKRLAEAKNNSDSELEIDYQDLVGKHFTEMKKQTRPAVVGFRCTQQKTTCNEPPTLFIEEDLLRWMSESEVQTINMSVHSKELGQRIGMVLELVEYDEE